MEKRFRALRVIGTFFKILGVIAGILTILSAIAMCAFMVMGSTVLNSALQAYDLGNDSGVYGSLLGGALIGLLLLLYGGLITASIYGLGEGIFLLIAVEENTRATRLFMEEKARQ